jgi:hypothetical protein
MPWGEGAGSPSIGRGSGSLLRAEPFGVRSILVLVPSAQGVMIGPGTLPDSYDPFVATSNSWEWSQDERVKSPPPSCGIQLGHSDLRTPRLLTSPSRQRTLRRVCFPPYLSLTHGPSPPFGNLFLFRPTLVLPYLPRHLYISFSLLVPSGIVRVFGLMLGFLFRTLMLIG